VFPVADYLALLPELVLVATALLLLLQGALFSSFSKASAHGYVLLAMITAQLLLVFLYEKSSPEPFGGLFIHDVFAQSARSIVLMGTTLLLILSHHADRRTWSYEIEHHVIILLMSTAMMLMVSSSNILLLYLAMELQALCLYVLVAIRHRSVIAVEAAMKFFILGGLASLIFLYGASVMYGLSGSLFYGDISQWSESLSSQPYALVAFYVACVMVLSAMAFKMTAVPFHMWAPDVYQGASMGVVALMSTVSKLVAVFVFLRLLAVAMSQFLVVGETMVLVLSVLSMTIGSLAALRQRNLKRFIAYSGIAQMGFALVGAVAWAGHGFEAVFVYMMIYFITMLGVFAVLLSLLRKRGEVETIDDLAGLGVSHKGVACALALFMFSLAGIPPFAGFFGKLYVFVPAIMEGYRWFVVWAVLMSVISAAYYLRFIKVMYMDPVVGDGVYREKSVEGNVVIFLSVLFTLLFIFVPRIFWDMALVLWASFGGG